MTYGLRRPRGSHCSHDNVLNDDAMSARRMLVHIISHSSSANLFASPLRTSEKLAGRLNAERSAISDHGFLCSASLLVGKLAPVHASDHPCARREGGGPDGEGG